MREMNKVTDMDPRKRKDAMHVTNDATESARCVGSLQPSIPHWPKVRAERALSVEAVMNEARAILWPDLGDDQAIEIDVVDTTRARR
jgi:hypothetical protein